LNRGRGGENWGGAFRKALSKKQRKNLKTTRKRKKSRKIYEFC